MIRVIRSMHPSLTTLLEIGALFLPAVPAYLWVWPNVHGPVEIIFQSIVYVYILAGTLWIGLRHWNWNELGMNRKGFRLALICSLSILLGRLLIILAFRWEIQPQQPNLMGILFFHRSFPLDWCGWV